MALPIFGLYIQKVFDDSKLPYSQTATFEFPDSIDVCHKEYLGGVPVDIDAAGNTPEESIDGVFD